MVKVNKTENNILSFVQRTECKRETDLTREDEKVNHK